eukprot:gene7486-11810_t
MSNKFKKCVDVSRSLFNQVNNETYHNFRYGINAIKDNFAKEIKPYDRTGFYLPKEMQIKQAKVQYLKETGRGGPKKGEGKKSKVRSRK